MLFSKKAVFFVGEAPSTQNKISISEYGGAVRVNYKGKNGRYV